MTSQRFYSAGHTDDTRNALLYITNRFPKAPLLALGFSLGSNVITRYLGEEQANARLHAACALACVGISANFYPPKILLMETTRTPSLGTSKIITTGRKLIISQMGYHLILVSKTPKLFHWETCILERDG